MISRPPEAEAVVSDASSKQVLRSKADENGHCGTALMQYRQTFDWRTSLTPHTITASLKGKTAVKTVRMDRPRQVEMPL
jgi:hypothetical protein